MDKQLQVVAGGAITNNCQLSAVFGAACAEGHDCRTIGGKVKGAVDAAGFDTGPKEEDKPREEEEPEPEATVCEKKDDW